MKRIYGWFQLMKEVKQTLAEQLQISEREIEKRKALLNISVVEGETLRRFRPFIASEVENIVERFYDRQIKEPEISLLIGDAETLRRLKRAMHSYILELFDGYYDADYVNRRLRIGKVHKRIGVSPKLYISAVWLLQQCLYQEVDARVEKLDQGYCDSVKVAINKLLMFDIQLVFDTYIASMMTEVQSAKKELERHVSSLEEIVLERTRQLEDLSMHDMLTGLYNQRAFYEMLRHHVTSSERYGEYLSLIYMDLNGFKALNDEYGHLRGDEMLITVGKAISSAVRESDLACRYGGDEFCVILPRSRMEETKKIADRIAETFMRLVGEELSFSAGIATTGPKSFLSPEELLRQADQLMFRGKELAHDHGGIHVMMPEGDVVTLQTH
jgi:diguanylate cyclase (GGDEF)-like protein